MGVDPENVFDGPAGAEPAHQKLEGDPPNELELKRLHPHMIVEEEIFFKMGFTRGELAIAYVNPRCRCRECRGRAPGIVPRMMVMAMGE